MANKPKKEFRAGSVRATIWEDTRTTRDNQTFVASSVAVERRYKDEKADEWRGTNRFKARDLPDVMAVARKAYEFLKLKERTPAEE